MWLPISPPGQSTIYLVFTQYSIKKLYCQYVWRSQGVTIPFFMRDRHACVHEHFETKNLEHWVGIEPTLLSPQFCRLSHSQSDTSAKNTAQKTRYIFKHCCLKLSRNINLNIISHISSASFSHAATKTQNKKHVYKISYKVDI